MNYVPVTIDFETTDKDPEKAEPIECGLHDIDGYETEFFIRPKNPIPPETSAVHHIVDADVAVSGLTYEQYEDALKEFLGSRMLENKADGILLIAHNASYEQTILRNFKFPFPVAWVCTYKVAMVVYSTAPSYGNEALRYWIPLGGLGRAYSQQTHSALHDARVTMQIFEHFLNKKLPDGTLAISIEDMIQITSKPAQLPRIPFGKHRGTAWSKVPVDYLQWLMRQPDMSDDVKFCTSQELNKRFKTR
jgi:DNA polymerase III, epsilon subunit and related 3''-5'' exonucleases